MIKNIFLDFNGTILDDTVLSGDIEADLMVEKGLKPFSTEDYRNRFYFPVKDYYHEIGFKDDDFMYLTDKFAIEYQKRWEKETHLFPNVIETLKALKEKGFKLYCISATRETFLILQLKKLGIYDYYDGICGVSDDLAYGKIDHAKQFIKDNNLNIDESIMVGDTAHDLECAEALGIDIILYTKGHYAKWRLEELNKILIDDLSELLKVFR